MATATSRHHHNHSHHHQRSLSPSGRFCSSSLSSTSSAFASSLSPSLIHRSSSPTRVSVYGSPQPQTSSVRFSIDAGKQFSVRRNVPFPAEKKRTCACSPTTHPGSFRCSFHRQMELRREKERGKFGNTASYQLNMRRSAMTNSLVRIGTVEGGESVRRALKTLIRPSSHQQRRRMDFQPRPSRLSRMSKAEDL